MPLFIAVLVIGLFQSLLLAGLIVRKRQTRQYPLLLLLLVVAMGLGLRIAYTPQFYGQWAKLVQLSDMALLLFGPVFFYFIKSATEPVKKGQWKKLWPHSIPVLAFLIHYALRILPFASSEFIRAEALGSYDTYYTILLGGGIIINAAYWFAAGRLVLKKYKGAIRSDFFLRGVLLVNGFTLLSWTVAFSLSFWGPQWYQFMNNAYQLTFVSLSATTIFISYYALSNSEFWMKPASARKYSKSRLTSSGLEELGLKLESYLNEERAYLNSSLSLDDLSGVVGVNKVQLSQVINQHFGKGFSDWVNEYRVEEFINRVESDEYAHFTFLGIALESGFNTKATFNKAFKKSKGKTPSQYFAEKNQEQLSEVVLS